MRGKRPFNGFIMGAPLSSEPLAAFIDVKLFSRCLVRRIRLGSIDWKDHIKPFFFDQHVKNVELKDSC
jgi:hypothetical protein